MTCPTPEAHRHMHKGVCVHAWTTTTDYGHRGRPMGGTRYLNVHYMVNPTSQWRTSSTQNRRHQVRKIEQQMVNAVLSGKTFSKDNTVVRIERTDEGAYHSAFVYLHGNEIAHYYWSGEEEQWVIRLSDAMWQTTTTKSRLNALLSGVGQGTRLSMFQRDYQWYYTMGASQYKWDGAALFMAYDPYFK